MATSPTLRPDLSASVPVDIHLPFGGVGRPVVVYTSSHASHPPSSTTTVCAEQGRPSARQSRSQMHGQGVRQRQTADRARWRPARTRCRMLSAHLPSRATQRCRRLRRLAAARVAHNDTRRLGGHLALAAREEGLDSLRAVEVRVVREPGAAHPLRALGRHLGQVRVVVVARRAHVQPAVAAALESRRRWPTGSAAREGTSS